MILMHNFYYVCLGLDLGRATPSIKLTWGEILVDQALVIEFKP
jgi:hypothetical protein